jgi:hypothetical protein
MRTCERLAPTEDWQQLQLLVQFPEQRTYELIRPVVLFAHSPTERARVTGMPRSTLYRQAAAFREQGMASLFAPPPPAKHHTLPAEIRDAILALKAEYPPLRPREQTRICSIRFKRSISHHTVARVLAAGSFPLVLGRRYPPYHEIADPSAARHAIVQLHADGWNAKSIAGYLATSRQTVHATLNRWIAEGVWGLDDKSHARTGVRKADLRAMVAIRELQENPLLGEWRMHTALAQIGIYLSPRTCGRIMALNRALYGLPRATPPPKEPRPMPFAAGRRHQFWSVDIRYLTNDHLGEQMYSILILDNYSRAILAGAVSPKKDLTAYLIVLYAAIRQHGAPEALVSDGDAVFRAKQAEAIYAALGIRKERIERKQPWQNYVETTFAIQRRMADWDFAQATTWAELADAHARWIGNYNQQDHQAHRDRPEGHRSPLMVLGWVNGRPFAPEALHRIFYRTRFGRTLDRLGYLRFRHWRVYGEHGLAREAVAVWLYEETLTVEYADEALAQYAVRYQPDRTHLAVVALTRRFPTPYQSPQLPLWELSDTEWLKVLRVPEYAPRKQRPQGENQVPLFQWETQPGASGG